MDLFLGNVVLMSIFFVLNEFMFWVNIEVTSVSGTMTCFPFHKGERNDEPKAATSTSIRSSTSISMSTDHEVRKSGSEFNSQNASDISTESSTKTSFANLQQRPSNLKVFTFSELKTATKNFSRSLMIGEGGFGGVYRGVIRSTEDPHKKMDIAVKQLSKRGLQVSSLPSCFPNYDYHAS